MNEIDLSSIENPNAPNIHEPDEEPEEEITQQEPEPLTEEELDFRRKLIFKLEMYLEEFPLKLAQYKGIPLGELSNEQLIEVKKEFSMRVNCQSNIQQNISTFQTGLIFLENLLCNHTPIKAQGLSALSQNKELIDDVKSWTLENIDIIETKPEHRILKRIAGALLSLHNANSQRENSVHLRTINEKYKDL